MIRFIVPQNLEIFDLIVLLLIRDIIKVKGYDGVLLKNNFIAKIVLGIVDLLVY